MSSKITLPSGAELEINLAPFKDSKALYMALAEEAKGLKLDSGAQLESDVNLWKDLVCTALASKKVELALWECMKRATYNSLKIVEDTFEPEEARQDYLMACYEVAVRNVAPFTKIALQKLSILQGKVKSTLG